jgi:chromate transport protein ChrA
MAENPEIDNKSGTPQPAGFREGHYPRITGGLILILLGVLFLLAEMDRISWMDWWAYFLVGLGTILILEELFRGFSESRHRAGRLIGGLVLIVIGGAHLVGFEEWWPLILIAAGLGLILSPLFRKK